MAKRKAKIVALTKDQLDQFNASVFGGEDIVRNYPELLGDGVPIVFFDKFWYIYDIEKSRMDTNNFFSDEELSYLTIKKENDI